MSDKIQQLINDLSADIIDTYDIHIPIYDMNDVVTTLGGYIEENKNICDSAIRKQNDGFVIYIPSSYNVERKQFAIAQELGHLFLHMGYKISPKLWNKQRNMGYPQFEVEK